VVRRRLYRMFWLLSATDYRVRRRFSRGGALALGALAGAAVVGLDTNQTVAYQAFTFLLALFVLALATGLGFRLRFTARRVLPRFATAGEPIAYRIVIENRTRRRRRGLTLLEEVPDPRPSLEEFLRADEGDDAADNWWDQRVGYARWQALITRNRAAEVAEHPLPPLPAGGVAEVRVELRPLRRGLLTLAGVTVARPDPFGLVRGLRRVALRDTLLVLPRRYPVPPLRLAGTRKFQQGGVALASSVGDSEEFAALRDYRPGDPRRRIHWRSWARVGRPVVREHQDEFFARHALVLDTFAGAGQGERFEAAVSVAASLACALDTGESLLDLLFVGPRAYSLTVGRGLAHVDQLLEVLAGVRVCHEEPFAALHRLVLTRADALSGCLVVLLEWDEARQAFVRDLAARGIPTLALLVSGLGERRPAAAPAPGVRLHPVALDRIAEDLAAL
jgi:uncharacterized protein (DUF58 family)